MHPYQGRSEYLDGSEGIDHSSNDMIDPNLDDNHAGYNPSWNHQEMYGQELAQPWHPMGNRTQSQFVPPPPGPPNPFQQSSVLPGHNNIHIQAGNHSQSVFQQQQQQQYFGVGGNGTPLLTGDYQESPDFPQDLFQDQEYDHQDTFNDGGERDHTPGAENPLPEFSSPGNPSIYEDSPMGRQHSPTLNAPSLGQRYGSIIGVPDFPAVPRHDTMPITPLDTVEENEESQKKERSASTCSTQASKEEREPKSRKGVDLTEDELRQIRRGYVMVTNPSLERTIRLTLSEYRRLVTLRNQDFNMENWVRRYGGSTQEVDSNMRKRKTSNTPKSERQTLVGLPSQPRPDRPRRSTKRIRPTTYSGMDEYNEPMSPVRRGLLDTIHNDSESGSSYNEASSPRPAKRRKTSRNTRRPVSSRTRRARGSGQEAVDLADLEIQPPIPRKKNGEKIKQGNHRFDHGQIQEMVTEEELRQVREGYGINKHLDVVAFKKPQSLSLQRALRPHPNPDLRRIRITIEEWEKIMILRGNPNPDYERFYTGKIPLIERLRGNQNLVESLDKKRRGDTSRATRKEKRNSLIEDTPDSEEELKAEEEEGEVELEAVEYEIVEDPDAEYETEDEDQDPNLEYEQELEEEFY